MEGENRNGIGSVPSVVVRWLIASPSLHIFLGFGGEGSPLLVRDAVFCANSVYMCKHVYILYAIKKMKAPR